MIKATCPNCDRELQINHPLEQDYICNCGEVIEVGEFEVVDG